MVRPFDLQCPCECCLSLLFCDILSRVAGYEGSRQEDKCHQAVHPYAGASTRGLPTLSRTLWSDVSVIEHVSDAVLHGFTGVLLPHPVSSSHAVALLVRLEEGHAPRQGTSPSPAAPGTQLTMVTGHVISSRCHETYMAAVACCCAPGMQHAPLQRPSCQLLPVPAALFSLTALADCA